MISGNKDKDSALIFTRWRSWKQHEEKFCVQCTLMCCKIIDQFMSFFYKGYFLTKMVFGSDAVFISCFFSVILFCMKSLWVPSFN